MKSGKKRVLSRFVLSSFTIAALCVAPAVSLADEVVDTVIAPGVLIEDNEFVTSLTFHAAIAFDIVDLDSSVTVCSAYSCAEIDSAFADSRGEFVAKISVDKIVDVGLDINDYNELTLGGYIDFANDETFSGSDEIYYKGDKAMETNKPEETPPNTPEGPDGPPTK